MKTKLTKQEKNWILYDVGNSAFTLLAATILPIYFNYIAGKQGLSDVQYLAYWDMQYPLQPCLRHLQDRYLEPLQIQKAIKTSFYNCTWNRDNCFSCSGICEVLAGLSGSFCHCKGRIFRNTGIL
mgnify:CR=1 FL=1